MVGTSHSLRCSQLRKWLVRNMPKLEAAKADLTAKAAAASAGTGASASTGSSMTAAAPKWPPTASAIAAAMAAAGKSGSASTYMSMLQRLRKWMIGDGRRWAAI